MDKDSEALKIKNGSGDHLKLNADEDMGSDLINSESRTPLKTPSKETEVKFIVTDSINGVAKIDMENVKSGFAGMSKEELLKYVDDPFWVRARTFLFIFFWLLWLVMFAAAISIIVMAPRCAAPQPRKWFEEGPIIDIDLPKSENSLASVTKKLDYFSTLRVKGLILSPIFQTDSNGNVIDFKSVSEDYGTLSDLKDLLAAAKAKAIHILMSLVPNHSSLKHDWFNKSVAKEAPYDSYYVWSPRKEGTFPNNWLNISGASAWTWDETRGEYYLHQLGEDQPDLNYNNQNVVHEMTEVLKYWLTIGVSGFNLDKVQYLLEDPEFGNEVLGSNTDTTVGDYGLYSHHKTYNYPGVAELLSHWRTVIRNSTENDGILIITGHAPIAANMNQTAAPDLVRNRALTDGLTDNLNATNLAERVEASLRATQDMPWSVLEATAPGTRVSVVFEDAIDPIIIATLLLKGTPITQLGDEQGLSAQSAAAFLLNGTIAEAERSSHYQFYKDLVSARESYSVHYGAVNCTVVDEHVFVLIRWRAGYPGFVSVWNSSPGNLTVDLSGFSQLPPELTVVASSYKTILPLNARIPTAKVTLSPDAASVLTFVPAE